MVKLAGSVLNAKYNTFVEFETSLHIFYIEDYVYIVLNNSTFSFSYTFDCLKDVHNKRLL